MVSLLSVCSLCMVVFVFPSAGSPLLVYCTGFVLSRVLSCLVLSYVCILWGFGFWEVLLEGRQGSIPWGS